MKTGPGTSSVDYKVPGGKLLRLRLHVAGGCIRDLTFTGDFFLHPEETLEQFEAALRGLPAEAETLRARTLAFWENTSAQLIGATPQDFVHLLLTALEERGEPCS